jgi:hypothetical protein
LPMRPGIAYSSGYEVKPARMEKFVFPFQSERVWLKARHRTWKPLAPRIKRDLCDAAKNVATIRDAISADAQVHSMPPVEIVAELWRTNDDRFIFGRATALERGKEWEFGVQLPASTAVHCNPMQIRRVLVHEFSHCFFMLAECIQKRNDLSIDPTLDPVIKNNFDIHDDSADRARLTNPKDWFGADDVDGFVYHDDPATDEIQYDVFALAGILPLVLPNPTYSVNGTIRYPPDIGNRISELLRRKRNNT